MQPSPLSTSRTFSSPQKETLYPINSHSPFFPPLSPSKRQSTLHLYESAYLNIYYKLNDVVHGLLCRTSSLSIIDFKVRPCSSIYQYRSPFFFPFLFCLPHSTWSSQARDQIWVTVMTYAAAATKLDHLTHGVRPGIEPASWCSRDTTYPFAPQQELQYFNPFRDWMILHCMVYYI